MVLWATELEIAKLGDKLTTKMGCQITSMARPHSHRPKPNRSEREGERATAITGQMRNSGVVDLRHCIGRVSPKKRRLR